MVFPVESVERVGDSWPRDAIRGLVSGGFQACLGLEGGLARVNDREFALNNVVKAVLDSAVLQEERDDQQAVIYCVFVVFEKLGWMAPNYEAVRRCVQHLQNELGFARISRAEYDRRLEKQKFVKQKWCGG